MPTDACFKPKSMRKQRSTMFRYAVDVAGTLHMVSPANPLRQNCALHNLSRDCAFGGTISTDDVS
jgi:hypothetical protein